jgi:hypothetical protein
MENHKLWRCKQRTSEWSSLSAPKYGALRDSMAGEDQRGKGGGVENCNRLVWGLKSEREIQDRNETSGSTHCALNIQISFGFGRDGLVWA